MGLLLNPSPHAALAASAWVTRWSHLVAPNGKVLDIACGHGRHMQWFFEQGHSVVGIDRSAEALSTAANWGQTVLADIENRPWPLMTGDSPQQFDAVLVTNYLWRALFPVMAQSLAPGGILIYETFSQGNETVGKPSRADFLLRPAELLSAFPDLDVIAFEQGFLAQPERFVQRLAAVRPKSVPNDGAPARYRL